MRALYLEKTTLRMYVGITTGILLLCIGSAGIYNLFASSPPVVDFSTATYISQTDWSGGVGTNTSTQYASATNIDTSTGGQISSTSSAGGSWYDNAWSERRLVSIDPAQVSTTQTNFPVLLTGANFDASFFSTVSSTGLDIIFADSDGTTLLPREIVAVSTTAQTLEAYVRIPSVSDTVTTTFYVYYGNDASTVTNSTSVWVNQVAVWHMQEDPTITTDGRCGGGSDAMCDSTANNNHATSTNFVTSDVTSTPSGSGYQFGGTKVFNAQSDTSLDLGVHSISFWMRPDSTQNTENVYSIMGKNCSGQSWDLQYDNDGDIWNGSTQPSPFSRMLSWNKDAATDPYVISASGSITEDAWQYITFTWDETYGPTSGRYFSNGVELSYYGAEVDGLAPPNDFTCGNVYIGGLFEGDTRGFHGGMDEMRITTGTLSSAYVLTEYNNQSAPATFASVGSSEGNPTGTSTLVSAIYDLGTTNQEWGTVRWMSTDDGNTVIKVRTSNDSGMSGATAFDSCTAFSQDADMTSNGCVTDGHRYMQYQVEFATTSITLSDIDIVALGPNTASVTEDSAGTVIITASIDETSGSNVTVPFTISGTASNPADHNLSAGSITITAGQLTGTTSVAVVADTEAESDETVILTMGAPTNAVTGNQTTYTLTITDDDNPNTTTLSLSANAISENAGTSEILATLSQAATSTVTITLATSGDATLTTDYTLSSNTITITSGMTTGSVTLTGVADTSTEGVELAIIDIASVAGGGSEYLTQQVAVSIYDYDGPLEIDEYHTSFNQSDPSTVGQYEVFEISLEHPVDYGGMNNVSDVTVTTTFTGPNGDSHTIYGFYFGTVTSSLSGASTSIWKIRFASSTIGTWNYSYQFGRDSTGQQTVGAGTFTIVTSSRDGYAVPHTTNPYLWQTENTGEYFQVHGFGDCLYQGQDVFKMDGGDADGPFREEGTDYGHWADIYREIGYNTFRLQFYNCSQNLADQNGDNFNFEVGQYFDHVIDRMHRDGFHILFGIWGFSFSGGTPLGTQPSPTLNTVLDYYDYVIARYGAYVDWWELENELQHNTAAEFTFATTSLNYIRANDPYTHPMTTNYYYDDRNANLITSEWNEAEFLTPHSFADPSYEQMYDYVYPFVTSTRVIDSTPKPVFFGELGNFTSNFVPDSTRVERTRSTLFLMQEIGVVQWNHSNGTATMSGAAANYLGLAERKSMSFVHWFFDLVTQHDTTMASTTPSNTSQIQAVVVTSTESLGVYVISMVNSATHSGETVTLETPFAGTGYWIRPESGELVSTTVFSSGLQVLTVPDFSVDLALFGTASSSLNTEPLAMVDITNIQDDGDMDNDSDTDYGPDSQEYGVSTTPFGVIPLVLDFSAASSSDVDGGALTYLWEFGDGNTSTNVTTTYTYTTKGKYIAKLTVTDDEGSSSFMTFVVRAEADANPGSNDAPYFNQPYMTTHTVREGDYIRITNYNRGDPEQASAGATYTFSGLTSTDYNVVRGLQYSITGAPQGSTFGTSTGATDVVDFSWVPDFDQAGTYNITMTMQDDGGLTDTQDYTIVVLEAGDIGVNITTTSLALSEDGTLTNVALSLDSRPTSSVTIALANADTDLTLSTSSIIFTSTTWDIPVAVTVRATDDSVYEGAHTGTISYAVTQSGSYDGITVTSTDFSITDNDTAAGLTITTSTVVITETGTTATYTIQLISQPTSTVTVTPSPDAQSSVSPTSLTFTSSTWNVAQTLTVTAVNDNDIEGGHTSTISHTVAQSPAGAFHGIAADSVFMGITDNDAAGVTFANTSSLAVVEGAATDSYTVVLDAVPTTTVTVTMTTSTSDVTLSPVSLTFTSTTWNIAQTVTITAVDNDLIDGTRATIVTTTVSSPGSDYDNLSVPVLTVTTTDNDSAALSFSPTSISATEGANASYTVALTTQPTSSVTVVLSESSSEASLSTTSIYFTSTTYNSAVTVTVSTVDNSSVDGSRTVSISHSASTTDADYLALTTSTLTLTINDNDTAPSSGGGGGGGSSYRYVPSVNTTASSTTSTTSDATGETSAATGAPGEATTISCALPTSRAYRSEGNNAVFYVTPNCQKRPFRSPDTFFTYFDDWSEVNTVSGSSLESISGDVDFMPAGPKYDPQYGALVKVVEDARVYLLLGDTRYWISSEEVFVALNYQWDWIEDVDVSLLDNYAEGSEIDYTDRHPNYTLVKYAGDPRVYRLEPKPTNFTEQVKRYIPNEDVFRSLNFRFDRIVTIPTTEVYDDGEPYTATSATSETATPSTAAPVVNTTPEPEVSVEPNADGVLSYAEEGPEITALQEQLVTLGYLDATPTGIFGDQTLAAVRAYQTANGITPTGNVGPITKAAMGIE